MNAPARRHPTLPSWRWGGPALILLLPLLLWPLGATVWTALTPASGEPLTFTRADILERMMVTLGQATLSTAVALVIGLPIAYVLAHVRFPGRRLMRLAVGLPLVMPTIVVAIAFEVWIGPDGWADRALERFGLEPLALVGTVWGIVIAHSFVGVAIIVRPIADAWAHLDREQEEAARLLGASPRRVFTQVTWPLLRHAFASATVLAWVFAFTSFAIVLIVGSPAYATIEVSIFRLAVLPVAPTQAALLALLQFGTALIVLLPATPLPSANRAQRRASARRTLRRSSWIVRLLTLVAVLTIVLLMIVPLGALIASAIAPHGTLTAANYTALFDRANPEGAETLSAVKSSLLLALGAAILSLILGVTTAMAVAPAHGRATRFLQVALLLPLAVPPNALALGYLLTFRTAGSIFDVPWLVLLVHAVIATPLALRAVLPVSRNLNPRRVEAAGLLGAPPSRAWRMVSLPHMRRQIATGVLLAACVSLGQLGATLLLRRVSFTTIPIEIYESIADPVAGDVGRAAALSTLVGGMVVLAFLCIEWLRPRDGSAR